MRRSIDIVQRINVITRALTKLKRFKVYLGFSGLNGF